MRIVAVLILATIGLWVAGVAESGDDGQDFKATLIGFDEVPSLSVPSRGTFTANVGQTTISYTLRYQGFETPVLFAHIHFGQVGVNGGVVAFLCGGGDKPACPQGAGTVSGVIDAADVVGPTTQGIAAGEFAEARRGIRAGYSYTNVHSNRFPGGEIRGQIGRDRDRDR